MTPREQEILTCPEYSETRVTQAVFPLTTNHHHTLSGGEALAWMERCRLVLRRVKHPIPAGSIVELIGRVVKIGNTSVKVEVFVESMTWDGREKTASGVVSCCLCRHRQQCQPIQVLPGFVV